jgi:hypothetical protein
MWKCCVQAVTGTGKNFRSNSTIELSVPRNGQAPRTIWPDGANGLAGRVPFWGPIAWKVRQSAGSAGDRVNSFWPGGVKLLTYESSRVLVLNPGSTSTKLGVYTRAGAELVRTLRHGDEELARFRGRPMVARLEYRAGLIERELEAAW